MQNKFEDLQPRKNIMTGFYRGIVEDRNDPEKLGRVRIRIFGVHTKIKIKTPTEGVPTEELPWAEPAISPIEGGVTGFGLWSVPLQGSQVLVFFEEGNIMRPMWIASLPGRPEESSKGKTPYGFWDPNEKYPIDTFSFPHEPNQKGENDMHQLATGDKILPETIVGSKKQKKDKEIQTAVYEEWDEPDPYYAAVYPDNIVLAGHSGITLELDNTPGSERLHSYHPSNSYTELDKEGNIVIRNAKNKFVVVDKNKKVHVMGHFDETIDKNETHHVKMNKTELIRENKRAHIMGYYYETIDQNRTNHVLQNQLDKVDINKRTHVLKNWEEKTDKDRTNYVLENYLEKIEKNKKRYILENYEEKTDKDRTNYVLENQLEKILKDKKIHVAENFEETITKNELHHVVENKQELIFKNKESHIKKDFTETIDENRNNFIKKDFTEIIKGDKSVAIKGDKTEAIEGDFKLGGGKIEITGKTIKINCGPGPIVPAIIPDPGIEPPELPEMPEAPEMPEPIDPEPTKYEMPYNPPMDLD
jgi:RNA binding exosome subunit